MLLPSIKDTLATPIFVSKANDVYKNEYASHSGYVSAGNIGITDGGGMILSISYSDYDEIVARDKLDAYIKAIKEEINNVGLPGDAKKVEAIDNVPTTYSSNGFAKFVLLGLLGGLVLGFAMAFLFYILDNTVSSKSELERLTGATVVAFIDDVLK